ncbi:hypothetical protein [Actinoplanes palleronii]|uniref:Uncharacterized protein n=1 Tax=Actinoplanes palleronii TaxID=113570 RepID=A0ABQ4BQR4_9ACTN|nr:hypothetical protein [Actinoplanes palleronii]GIE73013.1 hypothetical protein Apa02nite_091210 [Actinoplanes palleronii]
MRHVQIFTAVLVLLSVSACGPADPAPAAAPQAPSSAAAAEKATPVSSPSARTDATAEGTAEKATAEAGTACKLAAKAPRTGEAMEIDESMIKAIVTNAAKSGIARIEQAGAQVQSRYKAWLSTAIGDDAANAQDDLLDAVGRLHSACVAAAVPAS